MAARVYLTMSLPMSLSMSLTIVSISHFHNCAVSWRIELHVGGVEPHQLVVYESVVAVADATVIRDITS